MEKTLRILALAGVVGGAALVFSQARDHQTLHAGHHFEQLAGKSPATANHAYVESNVLQSIMQWHFCALQNAAIDVADEQNREDLVANIIKVNCYYMLALMRPDQQMHEIHDVWSVQQWVPNDNGWQAVCKSPTLVKEILTVTPDVATKVQQKWDDVSEAFVRPHREAMRRAAETPGFDNLSKVEQHKLIQAANQKVIGGRTRVQLSAANVARTQSVLDFARSIVTRAQRDEIDMLLAKYDKELKAVIAGRAPSFLTP